MSKLLHLTNRLKAQASWDMLTPGQRTALSELEKHWQFPDRINLYGPQGSGKTFLGWVMARQHKVQFYASPGVLEQDRPPYPSQIIIDNAPAEEKKLRRLLAELQLRQVRNVMLITQSQIRLGLPIIALPSPTETDITTVYENCNKIQFHPLNPVNEGNLWNIIYSAL